MVSSLGSTSLAAMAMSGGLGQLVHDSCCDVCSAAEAYTSQGHPLIIVTGIPEPVYIAYLART